MFHLSRKFFIYFVLAAIIPVMGLVGWHAYSIYKVKEDFYKKFDEVLDDEVREEKAHYLRYLEQEIFRVQRIVDESDRPIHQKEWQLILNTRYVTPTTVKKQLNKIEGYYDISPEINGTSTFHITFVIPVNSKTHNALIAKSPLPEWLVRGIKGPIVTKMYRGDNISDAQPVVVLGNPTILEDSGGPPYALQNTRTFSFKNHRGQTTVTMEAGSLRPKLGPNSNDGKNLKPLTPHALLKQVQNNVLAEIVILLLLGAGFSSLAAYYLKKEFIYPIQALSVIAQKISSGESDKRIELPSQASNEITTLVSNFNAMLASLEEKEALKTNFISNLAHDLRTPLISEERTLEILFDEFKENISPQQADLMLGLLKNNRHLQEMINLLLETYQFEEGRLTLQCSTVDMKGLMADAIEQLNPLAIEKKITVKVNHETENPVLWCDPFCIKRCMINLVGNALHNIPKGSTITITTADNTGQFVIGIRDNGPGIPDADVPYLFERFHSGQRTERKIGSGLGLYISKKFIEAHQGTIDIDTRRGEYTHVVISLPHTQLDSKDAS